MQPAAVCCSAVDCDPCYFLEQMTRFGHQITQCAAVCYSVLQCVAVCYSVLQCVPVCCSVLQCAAVCCSVLQCVAVCCSPLHCEVDDTSSIKFTQFTLRGKGPATTMLKRHTQGHVCAHARMCLRKKHTPLLCVCAHSRQIVELRCLL